jgi:hypothetical protein
MKKFSFKNLNLSGLDFSYADLSGADLSNADLSNANLSDANLSGADISDADLSDAIFSNTLYNGIKINSAPEKLTTDVYIVMFFENNIKIGCELHSTTEWENFTNKEILKMDGKQGLKFWNEWKKPIIEMSKLYNGKYQIKLLKKLRGY